MQNATMNKAKLLGLDKVTNEDQDETPRPVRVEISVKYARKNEED
jgi:hypothetical protein